MKKIIFIFLFIFTIGLISCNSNNNVVFNNDKEEVLDSYCNISFILINNKIEGTDTDATSYDCDTINVLNAYNGIYSYHNAVLFKENNEFDLKMFILASSIYNKFVISIEGDAIINETNYSNTKNVEIDNIFDDSYGFHIKMLGNLHIKIESMFNNEEKVGFTNGDIYLYLIDPICNVVDDNTIKLTEDPNIVFESINVDFDENGCYTFTNPKRIVQLDYYYRNNDFEIPALEEYLKRWNLDEHLIKCCTRYKLNFNE